MWPPLASMTAWIHGQIDLKVLRKNSLDIFIQALTMSALRVVSMLLWALAQATDSTFAHMEWPSPMGQRLTLAQSQQSPSLPFWGRKVRTRDPYWSRLMKPGRTSWSEICFGNHFDMVSNIPNVLVGDETVKTSVGDQSTTKYFSSVNWMTIFFFRIHIIFLFESACLMAVSEYKLTGFSTWHKP